MGLVPLTDFRAQCGSASCGVEKTSVMATVLACRKTGYERAASLACVNRGMTAAKRTGNRLFLTSMRFDGRHVTKERRS